MKLTTSLLVLSGMLLHLSSSTPIASPEPEPNFSIIEVIGKSHGNDGDGKHKSTSKYICPPPITFTSTFRVIATPNQVVNGTTPVPGQPGAIGYYNFGFNSEEDVVCYNITLHGLTGNYSSPAQSATHIHQALRGTSGPPRIAFPNPIPINSTTLDSEFTRISMGCLSAPFTTGIKNTTTGLDTASASGFIIEDTERQPASFFADVHTSAFAVGAVGGQLG